MDKIKFNNGKLTVLQISDPQDMHWVRKTMLRMLDNACDKVQPDLIVFTGDNILGNHLCDKRFGHGQRKLTRQQEYGILKKALGHVLNIAANRNIPFAAVFGNHDDRNSFTKDEQADIFRAYPENRGFINREELCGTDCLPVYSSDGQTRLMNFWMTDTARYAHDEDACYEEITKAQTDWFRETSAQLKAENGGKPYPSLMFMHIPFEKVSSFCVECNEADSDFGENGKFYKLADNAFGSINETVSPVNDEFGFYRAVKDDGGIIGIVSGHDHLNSFEGTADGIRFIATPGASFRSYGNRERGVRVFEFYEDKLTDFYTYTLNYTDLCGDGFTADFGWFWDADNMEKTKFAVLAGAAAAVSALSIVGILYHKFKR